MRRRNKRGKRGGKKGTRLEMMVKFSFNMKAEDYFKNGENSCPM